MLFVKYESRKEWTHPSPSAVLARSHFESRSACVQVFSTIRAEWRSPLSFSDLLISVMSGAPPNWSVEIVRVVGNASAMSVICSEMSSYGSASPRSRPAATPSARR